MAEPTGTTPPPPPPQEPEPERPSIIDAAADLLQTLVDFLKQEVAVTWREKVVLPAQDAGIAVGSMAAAGCLAVVGLIFIAIALLLLLARFLTWPGALALIGAVYLAGAAVFLVIKSRRMVR